MKLGIYGGTFNPPHQGHLIVAQSVKDQLKLDKIVFVPCASPPHKPNKGLASAQYRLEMTLEAVRYNPCFEVSDVEIARGGVSYTIDTVRFFTERFPGSPLFLIIGVDNYLEFDTWRQPQEILELADLVVMNREGFPKPTMNRADIRKARFVDVPNIGISGTMIRLNVKSGRSIRYLVSEEVEKFIETHSLYRD
jgi:nicotinate-nucleotide adenylyltransferase